MSYFKTVPMTTQKTLETCGGTVKFFGTNEPLGDMADFLKSRALGNALMCCAGGDQCLTVMGAAKTLKNIYAFDINPAQLFILACKARMLANKDLLEFSTSLEKISSVYENQVSPSHLRPVEITKVMDRKTQKIIRLPHLFKDRYVSVLSSTDFMDKPVYWKNEQLFFSAIRKNLKKLRFICSDILLLPDWFPGSYFDLIYISDIFLPSIPSKYLLKRLKLLLERLRPGGVIIGFLEFSYENTIIGFLRQNAGLFHLKELYVRNGLIILERSRR